MNDVEFLSRVSIFSLMKKRDLSRIAKLTRHHRFHKGDVIIKEGERDGRLFFIVSGEVEIIKGLGSKNQRHLQTFGPHSYFGEMALIDNLVRSASVIATKDSQVLSLDQWNLRQDIEKYPSVAVELLQTLSRRIRAIEESLVKVLGGFLPICANCKKIRNEDDSWIPIEKYITEHSEAEFSHGICPECAKKLYPEFYKGD
ncbi:MAG: cyclic nucleotide-binding domain-containing protein [Deltaproteobacteria bacterium]|nr:cyclic nucleotide-binding domain-containing protein [Deltaproteobacteria bacterium]